MVVRTDPEPIAVVTGASSGIGAAVALRLARRRTFRLLLVGRNAERLRNVATICQEGGAPEATPIVADLLDRQAVRLIADEANLRGNIRVLVNNAGTGTFGPSIDVSETVWDSMIELNLSVAFLLSRVAARVMLENGQGGTIVNIGSDADTLGFPEAAAYCASKGGLLMMSRALQAELRPQGIRVCVISPGRVDTYFNGKRPGMRLGALTADEVAEVVEFAVFCSPNIELHEIRLDSMARPS